MAIRFRCGSCSQPIEIDDEWATKTVACPYCRKTVTAPAESTLTELDGIPTATPMTREVPGPPPGYDLPAATEPVSKPNGLAVVALVLGVLSIVIVIGATVVISGHPDELKKLQEVAVANKDAANPMAEMQKYLEDNPQTFRWMFPIGMLIILGGLFSLLGIVCGVIAAQRTHRRGIAVAGLVVASIVPIWICGGYFLAG